jgi:hypothetical protein
MIPKWLRVPISAFASGSCFGIIVPMGLTVEHHQVPAPDPAPRSHVSTRLGGRALPPRLRCTAHSRPAQTR